MSRACMVTGEASISTKTGNLNFCGDITSNNTTIQMTKENNMRLLETSSTI